MGMAVRAIAAVAASFIRIFPSFSRVVPVLICLQWGLQAFKNDNYSHFYYLYSQYLRWHIFLKMVLCFGRL